MPDLDPPDASIQRAPHMERLAFLEQENAQLRNEFQEFMRSLSHDMRAPLRSIDGFSRALIEDHRAQLPPEAQESLDRIITSTQAMYDLLDQLGLLAQTGSVEFKPQQIDLASLARKELRLRQPGDHPPRVILLEFPERLDVWMDPRLARSLVVQLLSNALKFTRKRSEPVIRLESKESTSLKELEVILSDNGPGVPSVVLDRLFVPFQKIHPAKEFPVGPGVGLAICRKAVLRHGGRIWATPGVSGEGLAIHFTLPQHRSLLEFQERPVS